MDKQSGTTYLTARDLAERIKYCGHCVSTIAKAVRSVDKGAKVQVDLATRHVQIEPTEAHAQRLRDVIAEAGYTPVPVEAHAAQATASARSGGCCCGSGSGCRN